jgi:hypothetical protein
MKPNTLPEWKEKRPLRDRLEELMERLADAIKDVLLDWSGTDGEDAAASPPEELPPFEPETFVLAMREPSETLLRRLAEAINNAPTGAIVAVSEDKVGALFADFWCQALKTGVQLRLDTAAAQVPPSHRPQGAWARKLRAMGASGTTLHPDSPNNS